MSYDGPTVEHYDLHDAADALLHSVRAHAM
jgi:hypothetical protein